jgi:hypothetical protein
MKGEAAMKSRTIWIGKGLLLAAGLLCLSFTAPAGAQVQTQTTTTSGAPTHEVTVESGEVVAVKGNDLFVKMDDGSLRDFPNVPASASVTVDGRQLGIQDLKPGMKLQRTTVRTTTPRTVTTIETVTGKVWHVTPPASVILTLENGENQKFKIPSGQKFMVNGVETDAWGLKKGMTVTATRVTETPGTHVSHQQQVVGTMPTDAPVLIATSQPTAAPAAEGTPTEQTSAGTTTTASAQLPKTASDWPLIGLLGLMLIAVSIGWRFLRER